MIATWPEIGVDKLRAAIGDRLFLTVGEVCDLIRVDDRTLRRAIASGTFPGIRVGNVIRVPTAAFLRLAEIEPKGTGDGQAT